MAAFPPEIRGQAAEAGEQKSEGGYRKPMVGGPKPEGGMQKPETRNGPSDDIGEDAEGATTIEGGAVSTNENVAPPASDEEGYNWPEGSEVATEVAVQVASAPEAADAPLPSLDELVKRIPPDVRETLDELFRVKFVGVMRASPSSLKS